MAQVPYSAVPSVAPTLNPGNDYQELSVNPAQFGAQVGAAGERLGGTLDQAGNQLGAAALRAQALTNETMATEASTRFMQQSASLWADYASKEGKDAVATFPQFQASLGQLHQQILDTLPNPAVKQMYDQAARYSMARYQMAGASHAAQQQKAWSVQASQSRAQAATDQAVLFRNDPEQLERMVETGADEIAKQGELRGWDSDTLKEMQTRYRGATYKDVIGNLAKENPGAAVSLFGKVRDQMDGPSQLATQQMLKTASALSTGESVVNSVLGIPSSSDELWNNIKQIESGGQQFAGPGAPVTSPKGAVGVSQIKPDTARQVAAELGEPFDATRLATDQAYNERLGKQYFTDMMARYNGNPVLASAAYNAGPGAVDQWIQQYGDPRLGYISNADFAARIPYAETRAYVAKTGALGMGTQDPNSGMPGLPNQEAAARTIMEKLSGNPEAQQHALAMLDRIYSTHKAAMREASEKAANDYVTQMLTDPASVDLKAIASDQNLTYQQKWNLTNMAREAAAGGDNKDAKTYGAGFFSLWQRVNAAPDDPNRITDPSQLYSHVGQDLTVAGVKELTQQIQGRRTPDGEAEAMMKKQFLLNARNQISGTNEGLHIKDPKGDELYLRFLAQALPAYDAGRKAGKTAADLLNPDSPDYIGKSIASFKRPMAQWTSDMLGSNAPDTGPIDLKSKDGIVAAYRAGRITREMAKNALIGGGFATANPASMVPTGE